MIEVKIEPRAGDRLYEIHVGAQGVAFLVSHQGYENADDAEALVRRLWPPVSGAGLVEAVDLTVTYRNGRGKHEMLR